MAGGRCAGTEDKKGNAGGGYRSKQRVRLWDGCAGEIDERGGVCARRRRGGAPWADEGSWAGNGMGV
jgi:hypothetical protein